MIDALRSYLQLASGMAEVTAGKAKETATALVTQGIEASAKGPDMFGQQIQGIADDLVQQSKTNREILLGLIRTEIDRNVGRMGFVREEELAAVRNHLQRLEVQVNAGTSLAQGVAGMAVSRATGSTTSAASSAASTAKTAAGAARGTVGTARRTAAGAARSAPTVVSSRGRKKKATTPVRPRVPSEAAKRAARAPIPKKAATPAKPVKKSAAKKTATKKATAKKTAKKSAPRKATTKKAAKKSAGK